jgi:hypothetical protein
MFGTADVISALSIAAMKDPRLPGSFRFSLKDARERAMAPQSDKRFFVGNYSGCCRLKL